MKWEIPMYYKLSTQKILFFFGFKNKQTLQTPRVSTQYRTYNDYFN